MNAPKNNHKTAKILIVDDHPIVREGLSRLINEKGKGQFKVCATVEGAAEALHAIAKAQPDLAIIDIFLRGCDGIELVKNIRAQGHEFAILVLSMHDESMYAERALKAGADGYVMKSESSEEIIKAIHTVLAGDVYLSRKISSGLLRKVNRKPSQQTDSPLDSLTDRELEVFRLLGNGRTTRKTAEQMSLSIKTVETYISRIKAKLALPNINELIRHAVKWANTNT